MLRQVNNFGVGKHLVGVVLFVLLFGCSAITAVAQKPTIVFVHGKGPGRNSVAHVTSNYWTTDGIRAATRNGQARNLVVTYDGRIHYANAAVDVANQINAYLNSNPSERLVFVAHSYGGLVARFILCNGAPSSPFYNYRGANFARIVGATSHALTIGSPHGGSEVADVGRTLSNSAFTSWIIDLVNQNNESTRVLTTSNMARANTSELRDGLRNKAVYTVAGTGILNHAWHGTDLGLKAVDVIVPFRTANDGLVATWSAHRTGGAGGDWFNTSSNHDHQRRREHPGYVMDIVGQRGW